MHINSNPLYVLLFILLLEAPFSWTDSCHGEEADMIDLQIVEEDLKYHVETLTKTIGERSVARLSNLEETARYIEGFHQEIGMTPRREPFAYGNKTVANIVADIGIAHGEGRVFIVGAHYDSLKGTVGADDNASAIAVQLELSRALARLQTANGLNATVRMVSFGLEEPPVYASWAMGSRVYADKAKRQKERIDGMICLEMVGYTCKEPGCQTYPFPLMFRNYPKTGDYIGIVGNLKSRRFTRALYRSFQKNEDLPVVTLTVPWSGYLIPSVRLSDHASFWDNGYKAVMITDTAFFRNPHYHRTTDTMDKLDFSFMAQLVRSLVLFFLTEPDL